MSDADGSGFWRFMGPEGEIEAPIFGRLLINNALLRCEAARAGAGVLLCAEYLVADDIAAGRLVHLLPAYAPTTAQLHAVCPAFRAASPRVRGLIGHLTAQLAQE